MTAQRISPSASAYLDPAADGGASPAVRKACHILDTLADAGRPLGLAELTRLTGIPKSSVHSIVTSLRLGGLVYRSDASGDYWLGATVVRHAQRYLESGGFAARFAESASAFVSETGETCQLGRLEGHEVVYLAKVDGRRHVQLASRVGARLPANTTALGKALLAMHTDAEVERLYQGGNLARLTRNSITSMARLLGELRSVRTAGVAFDREEVALGLVCVAVPLSTVGDIRLAVSTSVPSDTATDVRLGELANALRALTLAAGLESQGMQGSARE